MKWFLSFWFPLFFSSFLYAAGALVVESPVNDYGTPVTVSISSTTLTKVPTSQTSGRMGVFLNNPSPDVSAIQGFFGNCTSTSLANTIRPIALSTGTTGGRYISMREDVCLWFIAVSSINASQPLHYQEVKQ